MNYRGIIAIYKFEMARSFRTAIQSIVSPVISTLLYFVVFGGAIGSRISDIDGVSYGAFIVPGLIMLTVLSQSIYNSSFGIYFPRFTGTVYEILSAPISFFETIIGYVGAAMTKSLIIGIIVLITSTFFVSFNIKNPLLMIFILSLISLTFSLIGFIIGLCADGYERLQIFPFLIITPMTFLGGCFYSIKMLPEFWQKVSMFNPVVYLINIFRWSFYGISDVNITLSISIIFIFLFVCISIIAWIFKTGYGLKN